MKIRLACFCFVFPSCFYACPVISSLNIINKECQGGAAVSAAVWRFSQNDIRPDNITVSRYGTIIIIISYNIAERKTDVRQH